MAANNASIVLAPWLAALFPYGHAHALALNSLSPASDCGLCLGLWKGPKSMKNWVQKETIFATAAAIALAAAALFNPATSVMAGEVEERVMTNKVLKAAFSPGWPPVAYLDDKNELVGFDVDVAKEIAKRMGVTMEPVTVEWQFIESGKWGGRWDIAVGSMTPTVPRTEILEFPAVYWYTPSSFAVHKDNTSINNLADLNGKKIGVCGGCSTEDYLKGELKFAIDGGAKIETWVKPGETVAFDSEGAYLDALKLGDGKRLDAVLSNLPTLQEAVAQGEPIRIVGEPAFYEPLAVAVDKGDAAFTQKVSAIIAEMHQDGTLTALSKKWFNGTDWSKPQVSQ